MSELIVHVHVVENITSLDQNKKSYHAKEMVELWEESW